MTDGKTLDTIFAPQGLLSSNLDSFEVRDAQRAMSAQVLQAYQEGHIALIEAGTGIGKSLAYLIPAVIFALEHKQKTIISTHTISLQEQLLYKDIPFLLRTLNVDLKATLVKGMSNYICLRKLDEQILHSDLEKPELERLSVWSERTQEGSKSDLGFAITPASWDLVAADGNACNHIECPHFKKCFFFKARREVAESQLLIVNHHLLLTALAAERQESDEKGLLPACDNLILDEAHHLEEIALETLCNRCDKVNLLRLVTKLFSKANQEQLLADHDLHAIKEKFLLSVEQAFESLLLFCRHAFGAYQTERKLRLTPVLLESKIWQENIPDKFAALIAAAKEFTSLLFAREKAVENKEGSYALELRAAASKLEGYVEMLTVFFSDTKEKRVRFIELTAHNNIILADAKLDVSSYLFEFLFKPLKSAALCSATLTTNHNFEFVKKRLGLLTDAKTVTEGIYDSPFDYAARSCFLVPNDLPLPTDATFNEEISLAISQLIAASCGNAFILFTSYEMLKICYELVVRNDKEKQFHYLKQGELPRHLLLEKFKSTEGSVLFGTDSFWEGVDVPGEALRCVILAKLPFKVPSDPSTQAYSEFLAELGQDPFLDYAVPEAVIKFKQGFGRLLRKKTDRGCVVCLDKRIVTKPYGKIFLKSLPPSPLTYDTTASIADKMKEFYYATAAS